MITHPFSSETVMAYLDGELPPADAAALAAHLDMCADCADLARKFRSVSENLAKWQVEVFPAQKSAASIRAAAQEKRTTFLPSRALAWAAGLAIACLLLIAIAVPNLMRSKMAANEANAVGVLRTLNMATVEYSTQYGHLPPSLQNLGDPSHGVPHADAAGIIDSTLASGSKAGYRFTYQPLGDRYIIHAEPTDTSKTGTRVFSTDETGVILSDGKPLDGQVPAEKPQFASLETVQRPRVAMIARTIDLSIVVKDFAAARAALDGVLVRHRGYTAQLNVSGDPSSNGSLQASLRIPASEAESAIAELKAFGRVERETQSGEEVTMQHADLAARISNARETELRLKDILRTHTGKVADVLEVEQQISQTRGQIEQMEAELKALETRVDFVTISLSLSAEFKEKLGTLSPSAGKRIQNALVAGLRDLRETLIYLIVWVLSSGPTLLLWLLILVLPARWIWRRWRAHYARIQTA
jgi:type II secretory pathway pseudopilin PulG